ncbi:hypothetical protein CFC21_033615 [Triticum aestivum]|uniref:Uncharacterized protein n=2 Tax=Triticum aestivum TaxID=4565 RepID=A0A9R1F1V6_WHEAT|nr:hypothetical protein CFC21_033615 [Triticum aestivum]
MVAAGPRLPCLCMGNPGSGAATPLVRHGRLAGVRVVDLAPRSRGRRDPVVIGGRRRSVRRSGAFPPSLFGPRFLLVAGSVQEALLAAGI